MARSGSLHDAWGTSTRLATVVDASRAEPDAVSAGIKPFRYRSRGRERLARSYLG